MSGDLDLTTVAGLRAALKRAVSEDVDIVVDCTDMTFIDSSGIAALLEAQIALKACDRRMTIINVAPSLQDVFAIFGVADLLLPD